MNETEFLAALARESLDFDRAMGWLARCVFRGQGERAALIVAAIRTLAASALSGREVGRRCRIVIESVHQDEALLIPIVAGIQGVNPSALNAIRGALPSHLRPLAITQPRQGSSTPIVVPVAPPQTPPPLAPPSSEAEIPPVPTVVLVGTKVEHAANHTMLNRSGFHPLPVASLELLWTVAETGLCGFVVAPSAWTGMDERAQHDAVVRLCSWSTFTFARISLDGLADAVARQVPSLLEDGLGRSSSDRFFHSSSANLTPADIEILRASNALLTAADATRFVPLDISREEALLLRLIAGHRRSIDHAFEVRHLGAAQMHGGKSNARIFMLQVEQGRPFVVKLDEPLKLRKELQLHQSWIAAWEPNVTDPVIHHHEGCSAISYRLQSHPDATHRPAPTLEGELERLRSMEWWDRDEPGIDAAVQLGETLEAAITRAADRLAELNKRMANGTGLQFWLDWPATGLAKRAVTHEVIGHDERTFDLSSIVSKAVELLAPMHDKGVVHGDIHGRNILLVDRFPAFIDYATSGPGNPLVDLVRLDATVRQLVMRATVGEKALAALFVALYVNGNSAADLLASHPTLAASPACRLALTTAAKTRACAVGVAEVFHCGVKEYLAMVAVIAAHTLAVRSPGSAIERAVLAAVAPILMIEKRDSAREAARVVAVPS